jgi:hypothetical protein
MHVVMDKQRDARRNAEGSGTGPLAVADALVLPK